MRTIPFLCAMLSVVLSSFAMAQDKVERADWGSIARQPADGKVVLAVETLPKDGKLALPAPFDSIVSAYVDEPGRIGPGQLPRVDFGFNQDATQVTLLPAPQAIKPGGAAIIVLEIADKSQQFPDGRLVFSALDAKVTNAKGSASAKLESHPGSHRIGFWTNVEDVVSWEFTASRPGMYSVEFTHSLASGQSEVSFMLDDVAIDCTLVSTGSWYNYTTTAAGKVYVKSAGKHTVKVVPKSKTGAAVMNLKAITLRPTGEGEPVVQKDDGNIVMDARDVTIHGSKVQYEPQPNKNTVGYWVNETDKAFWVFTVTKPGVFEVEILQGCGKGQGGSDVALRLLEQSGFGKDQSLPFVVEDTGHFQNFVPRVIGKFTIAKAGQYTMEVKPIKKAKAAVMDLRQVTLRPVKGE